MLPLHFEICTRAAPLTTFHLTNGVGLHFGPSHPKTARGLQGGGALSSGLAVLVCCLFRRPNEAMAPFHALTFSWPWLALVPRQQGCVVPHTRLKVWVLPAPSGGFTVQPRGLFSISQTPRHPQRLLHRLQASETLKLYHWISPDVTRNRHATTCSRVDRAWTVPVQIGTAGRQKHLPSPAQPKHLQNTCCKLVITRLCCYMSIARDSKQCLPSLRVVHETRGCAHAGFKTVSESKASFYYSPHLMSPAKLGPVHRRRC